MPRLNAETIEFSMSPTGWISPFLNESGSNAFDANTPSHPKTISEGLSKRLVPGWNQLGIGGALGVTNRVFVEKNGS